VNSKKTVKTDSVKRDVSYVILFSVAKSKAKKSCPAAAIQRPRER
jgi:hypothetical protein